jgi:predicted RNase H-like HicB family nuclease
MKVPIITKAEEGGFIALDPQIGTTTQGETYQEALQNLQEATNVYLKTFPEKNQLIAFPINAPADRSM